MKTIYSLQEFRNQLLEIAKIKNEDYVNVSVTVDNHGKVTFAGYVHQFSGGWDKFDTMEECLNSFRIQTTPPVIKNIDVEIDVPELVQETITPVTATDDLPF